MAKKEKLPKEDSRTDRETVAVRQTGKFGRITIPAKLRERFGTRFVVIETADGIELEPVEDVTN
jgi:AbrB family looped-hinge helix DNA binding protein